jgi:hypothetical protein
VLDQPAAEAVVQVLRGGHLLEQVGVLLEDLLDELPQLRVADLRLDEAQDLGEAAAVGVLRALDQVVEVVAVGLVLGTAGRISRISSCRPYLGFSSPRTRRR